MFGLFTARLCEKTKQFCHDQKLLPYSTKKLTQK